MQMNQKKTLMIMVILLYGAACFGGGALFGQHILVANGFVYGGAVEADAAEEAENVSTAPDQTASTETDAAEGGIVNINTASYDELMSVKGIGEVTAAKILDARNSAGVFADTYDLVTYGVMGDAKYSHLKEYLTVD